MRGKTSKARGWHALTIGGFFLSSLSSLLQERRVMVQTEDGFLATVVAVHEVCTSTTILWTENRFPRMLRMLFGPEAFP